MSQPEPINIEYLFLFKDGRKVQFKIMLEAETLRFIDPGAHTPGNWAMLDNEKCSNCPLSSGAHPFCPVAQNLLNILPHFINTFSYEPVHVIVNDSERTYSANITIQRGLSSLIGIIMVTSGCPVMSKLRPMVRFHLPFASVEETIFRSVSTYLLGQYFEHKNNSNGDWQLDGLVKIYEDVQLVNIGMANRLRTVAAKDANINALIVLDIFAKEMPHNIHESLQSLEYLYKVN